VPAKGGHRASAFLAAEGTGLVRGWVLKQAEPVPVRGADAVPVTELAVRYHFRSYVIHSLLVCQGTDNDKAQAKKKKSTGDRQPHSPSQQLEEHAAQREPVRTAVVRCPLLQHLGGHVPVGTSERGKGQSLDYHQNYHSKKE